jgi:hypothetical protein
VLLALVAVLTAAIADESCCRSGNPMRFAPFVWGVVALAVVTLMFFWRNVVSASRRLSTGVV